MTKPAIEVGPIIEAFRSCDGLSFAYGQGSVFAGFVHDSDLDINMIWDRTQLPGAPEIGDVAQLKRYESPDFALDKLRINGRPVDVLHHRKQTFDSWRDQVKVGDGWQTEVWPLPLYAISGFAYGVVLDDQRGAARRAREEISRFPTQLVEQSHHAVSIELPNVDKELVGCISRTDGWLFHQLLTALMRTIYVAWFAGHGRYCPHPKWLRAWVDRLAIDDGIVHLDQQLWTTPDLDLKRDLVHTIAERVLARSDV